jgi:hypothetical protein
MTSLFDLTNQARLLQAQIDNAAEGLFADDPEAAAASALALEQLITAEADNRSALVTKADAWCWLISELRATAAARKAHADRLRELADDAECRAEVLQSRLVMALQCVDPDATKWDLPQHKLTSRKTTAVDLQVDAIDLPEQFQRVKTSITADRGAIATALKAGQSVDGAQLVERRSWRIG